MYVQAPNPVGMIRPHHFHSNPETRSDNAYQRDSIGDVSALARAEFDTVVATLRSHGITVHDFDDTSTDTPAPVFPNNWFSTHAGGHVAIYPMYAANRRWDIIDLLKTKYRVQDVIDYSGLKHDGLALEGTGAMVLDHIGRVTYVASAQIVRLSIPTFETAGGSVRCMIASLHLSRRS